MAYKVMYIAVHLGYLGVSFEFRPFESHFEVHHKYLLSASGEDFLQNPFTVMSVDPQSNVVDIILGLHVTECTIQEVPSQSRKVVKASSSGCNGKSMELREHQKTTIS